MQSVTFKTRRDPDAPHITGHENEGVPKYDSTQCLWAYADQPAQCAIRLRDACVQIFVSNVNHSFGFHQEVIQ